MENNNFEKLFRGIFEKMPEAVAVYEPVDNGSDFCIKFINKSAEKIEKVRASKVINKKITKVFPSVKKFGILRVLNMVYKTGKPEILPLEFYKDNRIAGWRNNYIFKLPSGEVVAVYTDETKNKQVEELLKESEKKISTTLKSIGDAVIVTNKKGEITFLNFVAQRLTGWAEKEAIGKKLDRVFKIFNEKTGKKVSNPVLKVIQSGNIVGLGNHTILVNKVGKKISIDDSAAPIKDDRGITMGVVLVFHDVTEKRMVSKKLEETFGMLKESEARFRGYFNMSGAGIAVTSPEKGWIEVNDALCVMLGYSRKEILKKTWSEMTHPDDLAADNKQFNRVLSGKINNYNLDKRFICKDKKIIWTNLSVGCVRKPNGKVDHIVALLINITDRKNSELRVRESEENYFKLFDGAVDAIFIADLVTRKLINCNKSAEHLLGYSRSKILSMRADDLHPKDLLKETMLGFKKQSQRVAMSVFSEVLTKDKKRIPVSINSSIIYFRGKPYLQGIFRNITKQKIAEDKLKESEEKYRNLIYSLPKTEYVLVYRGIGKLLWTSDNVHTFLGISKKEVAGLNVFKFVQKEYIKTVLKNAILRSAGKKVDDYEIKVKGKNGKLADVRVRGSNINYHGQPAILLILSDITQHKLSESKIKENENKYKSLFDLSSDAIFLMEGSIFIECNNKTLEVFNCVRDKIVGMRPFDFSPKIQPDGRNSVVSAKEKIKGALAGRSQFFEWKHLRCDGSEFDAEVSLSKIEILDKKYILASVRDISERKESARLLAENQKQLEQKNLDLNKFKLAVDNASDDIIITDSKGVILYANAASEKNNGYLIAEIIGKTPAIWGGQMSKEFYANFWKTIKEDKKACICEMINKRKNGELYNAEIRVSPIINNKNEVEFFVGISHDITKLKELDRAKSEFVSVASHQLKTPVAGIKWMLESILKNKENNLTEKQKIDLNDVYENNERMISLINDLLSISRIDSGKYAMLNLAKSDIVSIIERAIKDTSHFALTRKVVINFKNYLPEKYLLNIDQDKIYQAILNLITNSIKYSKSDGGVSEIVTEIKNGEFIFSIKDNGIGIPIQNQRHIFEKFYRAENASTSQANGSGLGLYIGKYFIESHNGKVWFRSKEGVGTTFTFTLRQDLI